MSFEPVVPALPIDAVEFLPEGDNKDTKQALQWAGVPGKQGEPGILTLDNQGITKFGAAVPNYNFVAGGPEGTEEPIEIGNVIDTSGNVITAAGSTFQIADDYEGVVTVNLANANLKDSDGNKILVDTNIQTVGDVFDSDGTENIFDKGTIAENAPATSTSSELEFFFM